LEYKKKREVYLSGQMQVRKESGQEPRLGAVNLLPSRRASTQSFAPSLTNYSEGEARANHSISLASVAKQTSD